jgi:hypothetical protein
MRVKCTDTPGGVNAAISGSTVGLPGGNKNPIRVRHPFIVSSPHVRSRRSTSHRRLSKAHRST